ncbi:MAG: glycosyltransferase [Deferribacteres bacterium]|nr:glycosyltransferase [candidate division KSB1 bacterium]MCB9503677.1 glycosyltransferase [Deferribacteres bacterium]
MAEFWIYLSALIIVLYVLLSALIIFSIRRQKEATAKDTSELPTVSLVIAARNEEENLPALFTSLKMLDYPAHLLEIILIDDGSIDQTRKIAEAQQAALPHLHVISPEKKYPNLNGKANALHNAILQAKGKFIAITDADCSLPPTWLQAHIGHYDEQTAMVGGITITTKTEDEKRLFYQMQAHDWLYLLGSGSAAADLGFPLSIIGNNMSFRREAYFAIGGYEKIGFSLVEDFALMRALQLDGKQIKLCANKKMLVSSAPSPDLHSFLIQRKRWATGGKDVSLIAKGIIILGFAGKLLPFLLFAAGKFMTGFFSAGIVFLADLLILKSIRDKLQHHRMLDHAWLYPFFTVFYSLLMVPFFFFGKEVKWKGRVYRV